MSFRYEEMKELPVSRWCCCSRNSHTMARGLGLLILLLLQLVLLLLLLLLELVLLVLLELLVLLLILQWLEAWGC